MALDPAVYTQNQSNAIQDAYVRSLYPNNNYSASTENWVADNTSFGVVHSYLKVDTLPSINAANYITKAYLCLSLAARPAEAAVFMAEVTSPFAVDTVTYNTRPTNNSLYQDYIFTDNSLSLTHYYEFDVTSLVRKWYLGDDYGVVLTPQPEVNNAVRFHSKEGTRPPYLVVNYNSMAGLEGFLTYDQRSLGRAGTGHVSLYNGNLIFTHGDTSENGNLMPVSVSHVYNSCDAGQDMWRMGYGWRTSMHLTLHREVIPDQTGTNATYYVYTDGDGTLHHFKESETETGTYEDLSGLSLKLTLDTGAGTATMKDKGDNKTVFGLPTVDRTEQNAATATKMVQQVMDARGNTITVASTGLKITSVTDGAGRVTTFTYDGNNRCASILAPGRTSSDCVRFAYTSGNLTTITHEDNVVSTYTYNAKHLLITAQNADGRVMTYTYANADQDPIFGRPCRVTEFTLACGGNQDERRSYEYGSRMTVSKNLTYTGGKSLTYHFNDYGNLISVNDELGQASFTSFSGGGLPNHPDSVSRMQRVVTNLLTDHSMEDGSALWVTGNNIGTGTFLRDQTVYHMGLVSRKITISAGGESYCKQDVTVHTGKGYTFSSFVKTTGDVHAFLRVRYTDGGVTQTVDSEPFYSLASFTRVSVSFTLPASAGGTVTCFLMCNTNAGSAWFDCAQLEEGLTLNRYNMLQNSDFDKGGAAVMPTGWDHEDRDDYYQTERPADQPSFLTGRSVQIRGKYNHHTEISQELRAYGNKDDVYVAGGWCRGFGKEVKDIPNLDVRNYISVLFYLGNSIWRSGGKIYFNYEEGNWQFACGAVVAPQDYTYIRFEIQYYEQMNYTDFTNMFLYREEFGNTFAYDADGNIESVSTLTGEKSDVQYDDFDNMISYVQPGRVLTVKTVLEYGTTDAEKQKHLLKKSTVPMGVVQTFEYNSNGNPTVARTENSTNNAFIRGTTDYTTNQNYVKEQTDARGKTVKSNIDLVTGVLNYVEDPNTQRVYYGHDALRRVTSTAATAGGNTYRNEYVYDQDRLSQVKHNTTDDTTCDVVYNFTYDAFGKPVDVSVGEQILSANAYDEDKGTLTSVTYGNGGSVSYTRDDFSRITGIRYDGESADRFTYAYNAEGAIGNVRDNNLSRTHCMEYDVAGRPMRLTARGDGEHIHTGAVEYDTYNNLSAFKEKVGSNSTAYETTFVYDNGNRPTTVQFGSVSNKVDCAYDVLGRVSTRTLTVGGTNYATTYGFLAGGHGTNSTTATVNSISQTGQAFSYTYDNVGNIATEVRNGYTTSYEYDLLSQFTRVNDQRANETWTYEYDRGGNITRKKRYVYTTGVLQDGAELETIAYEYDTTWKDKLASYNGASITYDNIGNPTTDGTWTYTWQAVRQLASMNKTGTSASFAYNVDGLRIRKTVNGTVTDYTLHGKRVVHLKQGSSNLHFFYDAQGRPSVVDSNNTKYGYVYDEETGLYATATRYYSPAWGRFINADTILGNIKGLLNHNVYAYCGNNPVKRIDTSGLHYTTIGANEDLIGWINAQEGVEDMPNASQFTDELYELMQYSETSGITYDNNGASNKKFLQCASFISYALDRGLGIKYATGPRAILKGTGLSVFIGHMSDYSIDDLPAGTILIRLKGDFTEKGYERNHAGVYLGKINFVYKGVQYTNTPAVISLSGEQGEKATVSIVPYIGKYTHFAWPKGLALPNTPVYNASRVTGGGRFSTVSVLN